METLVRHQLLSILPLDAQPTQNSDVQSPQPRIACAIGVIRSRLSNHLVMCCELGVWGSELGSQAV